MTVKAITDIGTTLNAAKIVGDTLPTSGFKKLVGIRSTPAKGEAPEELDATEMHDTKNVGVPGRTSVPALEYTFNWTKENVAGILDYEGERACFLEVSADGTGHLITGVLNFWQNDTSLNSVVEGTINIVAEDIKYLEETASYLASA